LKRTKVSEVNETKRHEKRRDEGKEQHEPVHSFERDVSSFGEWKLNVVRLLSHYKTGEKGRIKVNERLELVLKEKSKEDELSPPSGSLIPALGHAARMLIGKEKQKSVKLRLRQEEKEKGEETHACHQENGRPSRSLLRYPA